MLDPYRSQEVTKFLYTGGRKLETEKMVRGYRYTQYGILRKKWLISEGDRLLVIVGQKVELDTNNQKALLMTCQGKSVLMNSNIYKLISGS